MDLDRILLNGFRLIGAGVVAAYFLDRHAIALAGIGLMAGFVAYTTVRAWADSDWLDRQLARRNRSGGVFATRGAYFPGQIMLAVVLAGFAAAVAYRGGMFV